MSSTLLPPCTCGDCKLIRQLQAADDQQPTTPVEAAITLSLSEYEASVITGALVEFSDRWPDAAAAAGYLRERVARQCPSGWEMS